jgi:hypothetical protein
MEAWKVARLKDMYMENRLLVTAPRRRDVFTEEYTRSSRDRVFQGSRLVVGRRPRIDNCSRI